MDEAESWSEPVGIISDEEIGYHVLNNDRVVQLKSGRLIAPVALHNRPGWEKPDWKGEIACYLSDDGGKSWRRSQTVQKAADAAGKRVTAQEPGVVELKDGARAPVDTHRRWRAIPRVLGGRRRHLDGV